MFRETKHSLTMKPHELLRSLREARGFSLREFARKVERSPTFISRLETGLETSVSSETIEMAARVLGEDPDVLLALFGKISTEVQGIVSRRPLLFSRLIRELKDTPDGVVDRITREVKDGDW